MDWNLLGIALLLTMVGFYFLDSEMSKAELDRGSPQRLKPARNRLERAWLAEPVQVFMCQLLATRQRRAGQWRLHSGRG